MPVTSFHFRRRVSSLFSLRYNPAPFVLEYPAVSALVEEISRRRTFAIIAHPDAGKTTLTEKLLWFGGAIQVAGEVRARKASRHSTSDWM